MDLFTVDYETYYDREYSLSKMSTEDYVCDPRFHFMLVSLKKNNESPKWFSGTLAETFKWMYREGAFHGAWLCHHTMFDGLCSAKHFKFVPRMMFDTRLMAQAVLKPYMRSVSLDSCLKHVDLGIKKGNAVHTMIGRTLDSLSRGELRAYAEYGMADVEGTYRLFKYLLPQFPREELEIIDMTLRMYLQPRLRLDATLLTQILAETRAKKAKLLASLPASITEKMLASNKQFAEVLTSLGVDPPTKISPTTNEITFAFSKNDTAFKELEEEYADDDLVSAVLTARLGVKSTIEESRTERLINIGMKHTWLRVPLLYYAAHTGRYGGMEKINMQNPPRVDKSKLRYAIVAPPGHVVLALDLAQIEARINAWLSGQEDLLQQFRDRLDPYARFASVAYRCDVVKGRSKGDDKKRFVGKTCILGLGYGMGAMKLRATLRKDGVKLEPNEDELLVRTYRDMYDRIPMLWRICDRQISLMAQGKTRFTLGPVTFAKNSIILPNGMQIVYHGLKYLDGNNKMNYRGWAYSFAGELRTLWGGKIVENIVQALARILVMQYMIQIKRQYGMTPALQVHDELDYVVPEDRAEELALAFSAMMRVPPQWGPDLPIEVEANYGPTFGDCK
jgi:DNA polymerase I-like protein with 3'-5' exonuclease and polymerase domains